MLDDQQEGICINGNTKIVDYNLKGSGCCNTVSKVIKYFIYGAFIICSIGSIVYIYKEKETIINNIKDFFANIMENVINKSTEALVGSAKELLNKADKLLEESNKYLGKASTLLDLSKGSPLENALIIDVQQENI
ncbi:MAG: hypothetical protein RCG15_01730 [Candidatus Rickettsia vulgarisii]